MAFYRKGVLFVDHFYGTVSYVGIQWNLLKVSVLEPFHSFLNDAWVNESQYNEGEGDSHVSNYGEGPESAGIVSEREHIVEYGAYQYEQVRCEIVAGR